MRTDAQRELVIGGEEKYEGEVLAWARINGVECAPGYAVSDRDGRLPGIVCKHILQEPCNGRKFVRHFIDGGELTKHRLPKQIAEDVKKQGFRLMLCEKCNAQAFDHKQKEWHVETVCRIETDEEYNAKAEPQVRSKVLEFDDDQKCEFDDTIVDIPVPPADFLNQGGLQPNHFKQMMKRMAKENGSISYAVITAKCGSQLLLFGFPTSLDAEAFKKGPLAQAGIELYDTSPSKLN